MTGNTVSHYYLLEKLGSGGMGAVYKATDLKLKRLVAIKFLSKPWSAEHKSRFIREARAAAALDHPNICATYEFGESQDDGFFIVMAYCPGQNLRDRLLLGPASIAETVPIVIQIAEALASAHGHGVLHRDIKPSNVMLTADGVVKLIDFGLAKVSNDEGLTNTGAFLGTVPYMSPEQLKGRPLDPRTDVWSWGVLTYEMLAGRRPFRGESDLAIKEAVLTQDPQALNQLYPNVPSDLAHIVSQTLLKNPEERYESAKELVRSLHSLVRPSGFPGGSNKCAVNPASIAVLPFVNLSPEPDSEYFSDGLTEDLINAISKLPNVRVVSRTSAFEFKSKSESIRKIGAQLQVATVLEGSVRKIGQKLRVCAQLVSSADGYCLWSQRFDRDVKDIFEIQDEIAQALAGALKVRFLEDVTRTLVQRPTENVEAYDLYLRGRFQWNKCSGDGLQRALGYFELALMHDPCYAAAYSGKADYYIAVASWGLDAPNEAWPKAKLAATRALELDERLAEAHSSIGTIRMWYEWNWRQAEQEFRRALELNPGYPNAHIQYGLLLVQSGRFEEAEREIRAALALDPLSVRANSYMAGLFHYRREYDRSITQCHRALEIDPSDIELHVVLGLNYEQKGMYADAIRELENARGLSGNNPLILGPLGSCYAAAGQDIEARKLIDELDAMARVTYVAPITWVMIYLALREYELSFQWLERAAQVRDVLLCYLLVGPIYDCVADDERYRQLLKRIRLAENYQRPKLTVAGVNCT
jgi:eukaryotic-like serine/threonine-protein kinase